MLIHIRRLRARSGRPSLSTDDPFRFPGRKRLAAGRRLLPTRPVRRAGSTLSVTAALAALADHSAAGGADAAVLLDAARVALGASRVELTLMDEQGSRWTSRTVSEIAADPDLVVDLTADLPLVEVGGENWVAALHRQRPVARATDDGRLLVAPLLLHGSVTGMLGAVWDKNNADLGADELHLARTVAQLVALSLGSATLTARLREEVDYRDHNATHDTLTGLANRLLFEAAVDEALAEVASSLATPQPRACALFIIDINRFKEINASLGHHVGDSVVVEVSRRIVEALPPQSMVARIGGDQFAVLLPDIGASAAAGLPPERSPSVAAGAVEVARTILDAVSEIVELDTIDVPVGVAIGVTVAPLHGGTRQFLLRRADVAMHAAKEQRQSAVQLYAPEHEQVSTRQLSLVADLRRALDGDELEVHYQPKSTIVTNQVVGVEALVRWRHRDLGHIAPDELIPLAEHTGLITDLTRFVLRTALDQCATWNRQGMPLHVAVNLSAQLLCDEGLPSEIAAALQRAGVAGPSLTLEITESQFTVDSAVNRRVLSGLRSLGVRLSIDDFGTGYSALAYLARLDVDELKIDKSFILAMGESDANLAIVRAVVEVADSLGLATVAEGVEDQQAWDRLSVLGCTTAQGYLLSRPLPSDSMGMWLWERRRNSTASLNTAAALAASPARHRRQGVGHSSSRP